MLPTALVVVGLLVAKKPVKLIDLVIHGEFLIYAITIVAGSTRLIVKDLPNRPPFVNRSAFNLTSHVMIFPAIFVYGLIRYIGATSSPYDVSTPIVVTYSILLLIAAFRFSYVVFLIDAQRSTPEELPKRVVAEIAHAPDKLKEEFSELQKQDPVAAQPAAPAAATPELEEEIEEEPVQINVVQADEVAEVPAEQPHEREEEQ
jgi:hypothetical protein